MPDNDRSRSVVADRIPDDDRDAYRGVRGPGRPVAGRASRTARRDRLTPGQRARRFVRTYGWRAYALPVLAVVTVIVLITTLTGQHLTAKHHPKQGPPVAAAPPTAPSDIALKSDSSDGNINNTALSSAALPAGPAYTTTGAGTFRTLPGTSAVFGSGPLHTFTIDVENGITGIDLAQFQKVVMSTLSDKRSWSGHGVSLQRVAGGTADFHITLTSAMTVRKYCGYSLPIETSCFAQSGTAGLAVNRVLLNNARWVRGDVNYIGDLATYRIYMVNHEDGHALGHQHAHSCLSNGLAPAMMQQTIGLKSATTKKMCSANPWPYPPGVTDAPGAEAPDTPQNSEVISPND